MGDDSSFEVVDKLFASALLAHLQNLDFGRRQSGRQRFKQFRQRIHFADAIDKDGKHAGAGRIGQDGVDGVEPFVGESQKEFVQFGQRQRRVHDLGIHGRDFVLVDGNEQQIF